MKIVDFEEGQGSPAWHEFRRTHVCASDVRSIIGICPFKGSPLKIWESKCLGKEQPFFSPAAERGSMLEPSARAWIEDKLGMEFPPVVVKSKEFEWAAASLDGINHDSKMVLELKCGGTKLHDLAIKGKIPDYYQTQIQWQLFCTGYSKAIYVSFTGIDGVVIEVERDEALIESLVKKCKRFWFDHVLCFDPPKPSDEDWQEEDSEEWSYACEVYKNALEAKRQAENEMDAAKAKLEQIASGRVRIRGCGISYTQTIRKGAVDYEKLLSEKGIGQEELETYRKNPSVTTTIRVN